MASKGGGGNARMAERGIKPIQVGLSDDDRKILTAAKDHSGEPIGTILREGGLARAKKLLKNPPKKSK